MINNLPTTRGQHWFKECGSDNWQPYYVTSLDNQNLVCHPSEHNVTSRCQVAEMPVGQWAKAHKPDEGIEAWAVFGSSGKPQAIDIDPDMCRSKVCHWDQESWNILMKHGYTCRKVRVCKEVENKKGTE